ncbi:MAG: NUDIX domain-containing protein [Clostridia bacterium]|nr:NUDIX domain-containing protein [Clostridia bacterium]
MDEHTRETHLKGPRGDVSVILGNISPTDVKDCMGAILIPYYKDGFILSFHKRRKSWEFPGGKREADETPEQCIEREAYEEAGIILEKMKLIGYYTIKKPGKKKKAAIFTARVENLVEKPEWSEMGKVECFKQLPENLSYKDKVYETILEYLSENPNC